MVENPFHFIYITESLFQVAFLNAINILLYEKTCWLVVLEISSILVFTQSNMNMTNPILQTTSIGLSRYCLFS